MRESGKDRLKQRLHLFHRRETRALEGKRILHKSHVEMSPTVWRNHGESFQVLVMKGRDGFRGIFSGALPQLPTALGIDSTCSREVLWIQALQVWINICRHIHWAGVLRVRLWIDCLRLGPMGGQIWCSVKDLLLGDLWKTTAEDRKEGNGVGLGWNQDEYSLNNGLSWPHSVLWTWLAFQKSQSWNKKASPCSPVWTSLQLGVLWVLHVEYCSEKHRL